MRWTLFPCAVSAALAGWALSGTGSAACRTLTEQSRAAPASLDGGLIEQATRLELGEGARPDPERAMMLFCRAAAGGSGPAARHIAAWLLDPDADSYDPRLAARWLTLAELAADRARWRPPTPPCPSDTGSGLPGALVVLPFTVDNAARAAGLPPALVKAVITAESGFRSDAVSDRGAVGLMQLMPDTALRWGVADRYDPIENLRGGTQELAALLNRYGGDLALALAAYNAGTAPVDACHCVPPIDETIAYVARVRALYDGAVWGGPDVASATPIRPPSP